MSRARSPSDGFDRVLPSLKQAVWRPLRAAMSRAEESAASRRRQRALEQSLASGPREEPIAAGEAETEARASSRRARRQLLQPPGEVDVDGGTPGRPRSRRRGGAADDAADDATGDSGADLTPSAEGGRSRRRRQAEGVAESAVGTASGAVRAAFDRISPRRRPASETELLALVPDQDDLMSQQGGLAPEAEGADQLPFGGAHGGGRASRGNAATWVEDAATGSFYRAADARRREPGAKRRLMETLGLTRSGDAGPTERMVLLAARARAVISATLMVSEGVLAGMALLHILVVQQCAQRPFLIVGYLKAARATQQTFHLLCSLAMLSSLVALGSASQQLERLERSPARWDHVQQHRDASYQQAAAALVVLLYTVALICSLLTVRASPPPAPPPAPVACRTTQHSRVHAPLPPVWCLSHPVWSVDGECLAVVTGRSGSAHPPQRERARRLLRRSVR